MSRSLPAAIGYRSGFRSMPNQGVRAHADIDRMTKPKFSKVTRSVAAVFMLAGVGALLAGVSAGTASDGMILAGLAAGFLVIGLGVWMEYLWAWWAATGVSAFTVIMTLASRFPIGSAVIWSVVLGLLVASAVQGRSRSEP